MTWHELVDKTHADFQISKRVPRAKLEGALRRLFMLIAEQALHGKRVSIPGFGVFVKKTRRASRVLNPITHEPMMAPASVSVGFRCSKTIKR